MSGAHELTSNWGDPAFNQSGYGEALTEKHKTLDQLSLHTKMY